MSVDLSIQFFLHSTGDKIVKDSTVLENLQFLETIADNGGFSSREFSDLCKIVLQKPMAAQISRRFLSCLVPNQPVQGKQIQE